MEPHRKRHRPNTPPQSTYSQRIIIQCVALIVPEFYSLFCSV